MKESEGFALNMRIYRSLCFQLGKDETNKDLRDKVYQFEQDLIQKFYPDQKPIGFHIYEKTNQ